MNDSFSLELSGELGLRGIEKLKSDIMAALEAHDAVALETSLVESADASAIQYHHAVNQAGAVGLHQTRRIDDIADHIASSACRQLDTATIGLQRTAVLHQCLSTCGQQTDWLSHGK